MHTPAYPGFEVEVDALRADPTPIANLTGKAVVDHLDAFLRSLDTPTKPILMGHSAGGTFLQLLLDRGHGSAAVALNSAPTEGVRTTPFSQVRSVFPVVKNPANRRRAVGLSFEEWTYAFTNTYTEEQSRDVLRPVPRPGVGPRAHRLGARQLPAGHQDAWVDFRNPDRAPLLFLSGSEDHIMPPSVQASNAQHYRGPGTLTEHETYEGRPHLMVAGPGWEEIADRALEWARPRRVAVPCDVSAS